MDREPLLSFVLIGVSLVAPSPASSLAADDPNPVQVVVPGDAGLINVRDHGLKGDGTTDDTAALQQLVTASLNQHKTLFFPAGTYLLSDSILWANHQGEFWPWLTWQGEGRGRTILRLRDRAPGFNDPAKPKPLVKTGCYNGETRQNAAHNCYFFDLTLNTGRGNPGAIGLDYVSNNNGAVVRVDIISEDGSGVAGLSMLRDSPGPALVQHVSIRGFDTGIALNHLLFSMTFEHIHIEGQRRVGLAVQGNVAAVRRLTSVNRVPAVRARGWAAAVVLLDSHLSGGDAANAAIEADNAPTLLLRNVLTAGYQQAARIVNDKREQSVPGGLVEEFLHGERFTLFRDKTRLRTLNLPILEAPVYFGEADQWVNVRSFGAKGDGRTDDSEAIQKAIDSGKAVVYLPHAKYYLAKPVVLRGSVRRVIGYCADLKPGQTQVLFRCEKHDTSVSLERLYLNGRVEHAGDAPVILRHTLGPSISMIGKKRTWFLEDVLTAKFAITADSRVYARQFNCEPEPPGAGFENNGGIIWVLGLKTEWGNTIGITRKGGQTEILGGLMLPAQGFKDTATPAFVVEDAKFSATWNEITFGGGTYINVVRETHQGQTRILNPHGEGTQRAWSLYSNYER